jgi:hypothetical protein
MEHEDVRRIGLGRDCPSVRRRIVFGTADLKPLALPETLDATVVQRSGLLKWNVS